MGSPAPFPLSVAQHLAYPRFTPYLGVTAAKHCVSTTQSATLRGLLRHATVNSAIHTVVPRKQHLSRFDPPKSPPWTWRQTAYKPGSVPSPGVTAGAVMTIPLGRSSPSASCDRPERRRGGSPGTSDYSGAPAAPTWSCSRWGFPCRRRCRRRGALLPHRFTLAARPACRRQAGGVLSVALSLGSPPPGVTRHRTSVEPGLSSPRTPAESGHPTVWRQQIWAVAVALSKPPPRLL